MSSSELTPEPAPTQTGPHPLAQWLLDIDRRLEGRRLRLLAILAVVHVLLAPMWDRMIEDMSRFSALRDVSSGVARFSFASMEGLTALAGLALFAGAIAVGAGRVAALLSPDEYDERTALGPESIRRVGRLIWSEVKLAWRGVQRRDPATVIGLIVGIEATRSALAVFRHGAWGLLVEPFDAQRGLFAGFLENMWVIEGGLLLGASAGMLWVIQMMWKGLAEDEPKRGDSAYRPTQQGLRQISSARGVIALVDGEVPAIFGDAYATRKTQELMLAISRWTPDPALGSESDQQLELGVWLEEQGYSVELERYLKTEHGYRRVDIVVDGLVALELKYRLHQKSDHDRTARQLRAYAGAWGGVGPVVGLFICSDPSHRKLSKVEEECHRWNERLEKGSAPIHLITIGDYADV